MMPSLVASALPWWVFFFICDFVCTRARLLILFFLFFRTCWGRLTSSAGSGIVTEHKQLMRNERVSQVLGGGGTGMLEINDYAFTASVIMILNGVNLFVYQLVLLQLYQGS